MSRKKWTSDRIFDRLLTNKSSSTYWDNIQELRTRVNSEVYNRAYSLVLSNKENETIIGVYVLAQLGFEPRMNQRKTLDLYFNILSHTSAKVKAAVLSSIGHNNENLSQEEVTSLIQLKDHPDSNVRFELVMALQGIENNDSINTLITLSKDKNADVRNWATFGLGSQLETNNRIIIDALWDRVNDDNEDTKREAINGLAQRKDSRIKQVLIDELEKLDYVDYLIFESIEHLNDIQFIDLLKQKKKSISETNEDLLEELQKSIDALTQQSSKK